MKYEIFQVVISNELCDRVNRLGHAAAAKAYPKYEAHLEKFSGSEGFQPKFLKHYDHVATVEADNLDQVFEIGNGYGDQSKIEVLGEMHSLSVGDIVRLNTGTYMMVDPMGFTEVSLRDGVVA